MSSRSYLKRLSVSVLSIFAVGEPYR